MTTTHEGFDAVTDHGILFRVECRTRQLGHPHFGCYWDGDDITVVAKNDGSTHHRCGRPATYIEESSAVALWEADWATKAWLSSAVALWDGDWATKAWLEYMEETQ